jgi:hypothetical protein
MVALVTAGIIQRRLLRVAGLHPVVAMAVVIVTISVNVMKVFKDMIAHSRHAHQVLHGGMKQVLQIQHMHWQLAQIEESAIQERGSVFANLVLKELFVKEYHVQLIANLENVQGLVSVIPRMSEGKNEW